MSTVLYLEPVGGIAGDMFLAADARPRASTRRRWRRGCARSASRAGGFEVSRAVRQSISGTHLDVEVVPPRSAHVHRALAQILGRIDASALPPRAKAQALRGLRGHRAARRRRSTASRSSRSTSTRWARWTRIVDVCGAALALELLGQPEVFSAPPPLGSGMVETMHGRFPVPAPATLEILRDLPVRFEGQGELTTPTGAALLRALCAARPSAGAAAVSASATGSAAASSPDRPNVLRATLGTRGRGADVGRVGAGGHPRRRHAAAARVPGRDARSPTARWTPGWPPSR